MNKHQYQRIPRSTQKKTQLHTQLPKDQMMENWPRTHCQDYWVGSRVGRNEELNIDADGSFRCNS